MLLSEISTTPSANGQQMLAQLLEASPLLRALAFRRDGTDYSYYPVAARDLKPARREIGQPNAAQARQPEVRHAQQFILSEDLTIDATYVADAELGLRSLDTYMRGRMAQTAQAFAAETERQMLAGTGTGGDLAGLGTVLGGANVAPWSESFVIEAAANSLDLAVAANEAPLLEALRLALAEVPGATAIVMARGMLARMQTIATRQHALTWDRDAFGLPVSRFNGVPLIGVAPGAIATTEPSGHATPQANTTSVYVLRAAEFNAFTMVSNEGFRFDDWRTTEAAPHARSRAEIRFGFVVESDDAVRRIRRIKL